MIEAFNTDLAFVIMLWNMCINNIILCIPIVLMLFYIVLKGFDKIKKLFR